MHWTQDPKNRNKVLALAKKSHRARRRNLKISRAEVAVRKATMSHKRTRTPVDSESRSTYRLVADQAVNRNEVHLLAQALGMASLRKVMGS